MLLWHNVTVFRIALVIGVHNLGHMVFFTRLFSSFGINVGQELNKFLSSRNKKKEWKRAYEKQYDVKVSRLNAKNNRD